MSSPRITPKPLPRITPNTRYAEDGSPLTRFESYPPIDPLPKEDLLSLRAGRAVVIDKATDCKAKILRNGSIAIGDLY